MMVHDEADVVTGPSQDILSFVQQLIPAEEWGPKSVEELGQLPSFYQKIQRSCERLKTPYAELSHDLQDALVFRRLQQLVNTVRLNDLWKERLQKAGISGTVETFQEWQQIPLSDDDLLNTWFAGQRDGMVVPLNHGLFEIIASGGTTTEVPLETVFSLGELKETHRMVGDFLGRYVLKNHLLPTETKWVVNLYADYHVNSMGTLLGGGLQHIDGVNYIAAGPLGLQVYQHMMSYEGQKAILGTPQAIGGLYDMGMDLPQKVRESLRVAMYSSGFMPQKKLLELKLLYPHLTPLSYFSTAQTGMMGVELEEGASAMATVPGLHFVEVVDQHGQWVAEGEEGHLVVTRLLNHTAPLLRLRTKDRVIRLPRLNKPGLQTHQFAYAGRSGDIIKLSDFSFPARKVFDALANSLKISGVVDLKYLAYETQFLNHSSQKTLTLYASADDPIGLMNHLVYTLGAQGVRVFWELWLRNCVSYARYFRST
ncbi:MAG: hypothetical protein AAFQ98_21545, partial [Bacteroidota bacterium]